jgi:hypothetical protein
LVSFFAGRREGWSPTGKDRSQRVKNEIDKVDTRKDFNKAKSCDDNLLHRN